MGAIVALGERARLAGLELAGAAVVPAETPEQVRAAWAHLDGEAALVILTPAAAHALADEPDTGRPLRAVIPE
ncbi:MAG TPA: hypothetical protein VFH58_15120 [Acidimicrobiales bacterium]|nr:hypothetical protein [Acidimicrobiales bacterium]